VNAVAQAHVDVELLVFMETFLRTRSASQTARQLQLDGPTVDRRVSVLRALFDDPLIVQLRGEAMLTLRATELQARLQPSLNELRVLLAGSLGAAASAKNHFHVGVAPECEAIVPEVFANALSLANDVRLDFQPLDDVATAIELGSVDMAVAAVADVPRTFHVQALGMVDFGFFVGEQHALAGRMAVSAEDLLGWPHVDLRASRKAACPVDDAFMQRGLRRPVAGVFFSAASAVAAARRQNGVLAAPAYAMREQLDESGLRRVDTAFDMDPSAFALAWHDRLHRDPAQAWLRWVIAKSARSMMARHSSALEGIGFVGSEGVGGRT
jgi:DNA-binding transcriptional LysR family regulator